ncbi:GerAB/ArcD/ProY family transporter [Ornithinibacillus halotolerans]|uniref:Germination protein GerB n=1 Tax=Ornithinibacillus halotolerans TaxID=1274357 RepID=A0A916S5Z8_9BACI|nr:GerAB/ArcD/ProY family transporter [Ornithinibacillus halotolerans]GGA85793.1 germination protein GerB [Ornithinibacillus halotolerans]
MELNVSIKPGNRIRAIYLFFIIISVQIGVGIIGAPRFIYMEAERSAWLSILIAFLYICVLVSCMLIILKKYDNADLLGIQVDLFGNFFGKLLGIVFLVHLGLSMMSILLTYIQVIQLFLYHAMPNLLITSLIMILVLYTVYGGIRVIVGVTFILFLITMWILTVLYDPFLRANWYNLLPLFDSSLPDILKGTRATSYTLAGFEILWLIYPFIQNKNKVRLPIFLGLAFTTIILLVVTVLSISYFSAEGLKTIDWAVLILVKNASFTFLERLDYIVVVMWLMIILPNLTLLMWGMTFGAKRLFKVPQKISIWILTVLILILVNFFHYDYQITKVTDLVARFGFWITYVYPFLLLPIVLIKKRQKKPKGSDKQ